MNKSVSLFLIPFCLILTSCATTRTVVNYQAYEKPNDVPAANAARDCLMKLPSSKKLFYGNYGGLGSNGGLPIDQMDELFRRHDIVYTEAKTLKVVRVSDEVLIKYLQKIPDDTLDEDGQAYRDLAIKYFENPLSKYLVKPTSTLFRFQEPVDSPFPNPASVIHFFCPDHPGFPEFK